MNETRFEVRVRRSKDDWEVDVSDRSGGAFAKTSGDLWTALRMAVPYMAAASEPDPLYDEIRKMNREDGW
jgi:hypothetical protein